MKNPAFYIRIFLAVVAGEIALILLSSLVQAVLFDGIFWTKSSWSELLIGGVLTVLAALVSGMVAMIIVKRANYFPHVGLSLLVAAETSWLIATHQTPDPAWFDALAGLSLIGGIWLGGWLLARKAKLLSNSLGGTAFFSLLFLFTSVPCAKGQDVPLELAFQSVEWSPDGKQLLFSAIYRKADWSDYSPEKWKLMLLDLKTGQSKLVTDAAPFGAFSPDGKKVAYGKIAGDKDIFVKDLSTGEERRLTTDPASDAAPSWSPDGSQIAFNSKRTGTTEIFIMDANGNAPRQLTNSGAHRSYNPQWSPRGNQIVYYFEKGDRKDQVWLTDSQGSFFKNLTADTLNNYFAGWTPSGIIYAAGDEKIFTIGADGAGKKELKNVRSFYARVSPNGKWIAYFDKESRSLVVQRFPSGKKKKAVFSVAEYLKMR